MVATNLNGWFFRSMYYDELVDMGAQFTTQNDTVDESYDIVSTDEQFDYSPNFVKYGKGWLLKPDDKFVYDHSRNTLKVLGGCLLLKVGSSGQMLRSCL